MSELFRETPFGHTLRLFTGNKVFQYPEERTYFELPAGYSISDGFSTSHGDVHPSQGAYSPSPGIDEKIEGHDRAKSAEAFHDSPPSSEKFHAIVPSVSEDGTILVTWYSSDDPANPQNWPGKKKAFVAMQIWYILKS